VKEYERQKDVRGHLSFAERKNGHGVRVSGVGAAKRSKFAVGCSMFFFHHERVEPRKINLKFRVFVIHFLC
jgi:hypothetical protein